MPDKSASIEYRINHLILDDIEIIRKKINKVMISDAIDFEKYEKNSFRLPNIILYAIYKELLFQRKPNGKEDLQEADNLYLFI